MPSARTREAAKIALALPIYQILNLVAYANARQGRAAKIATFITFLPIIAFTTVCWAAAWAACVWLALRLVD
jgi:hypothetical protein